VAWRGAACSQPVTTHHPRLPAPRTPPSPPTTTSHCPFIIHTVRYTAPRTTCHTGRVSGHRLLSLPLPPPPAHALPLPTAAHLPTAACAPAAATPARLHAFLHHACTPTAHAHSTRRHARFDCCAPTCTLRAFVPACAHRARCLRVVLALRTGCADALGSFARCGAAFHAPCAARPRARSRYHCHYYGTCHRVALLPAFTTVLWDAALLYAGSTAACLADIPLPPTSTCLRAHIHSAAITPALPSAGVLCWHCTIFCTASAAGADVRCLDVTHAAHSLHHPVLTYSTRITARAHCLLHATYHHTPPPPRLPHRTTSTPTATAPTPTPLPAHYHPPPAGRAGRRAAGRRAVAAHNWRRREQQSCVNELAWLPLNIMSPSLYRVYLLCLRCSRRSSLLLETTTPLKR